MSERFRIRLDEAVENALAQSQVMMCLGNAWTDFGTTQADVPFDFKKVVYYFTTEKNAPAIKFAVPMPQKDVATELGDALPSEVEFGSEDGVIIAFNSNPDDPRDRPYVMTSVREGNQYRHQDEFATVDEAIRGALQLLGVES